MKKEQIKMIISDIDGTLINDYDELPENFEEMVNKLKELNIIFVAASGRGAKSIKAKLNYEADNLYVISDNGALIMHQDEMIRTSHFSHEEYLELVKHFLQFEGNTIGVTTTNTSYLQIGSEYANENLIDEFYHGSALVDDVLSLTGDVVGLSVHNKHDTIKNFNHPDTKKLLDKYTLVQAGAEWTDAIPKTSNKGNSVKYLCEHLGIDVDEAIAFGDYDNDIEMLQTVHKGYAMQDATDNVKAVADEVIGSNNDNSVIKKIYELLDL